MHQQFSFCLVFPSISEFAIITNKCKVNGIVSIPSLKKMCYVLRFDEIQLKKAAKLGRPNDAIGLLAKGADIEFKDQVRRFLFCV